MGSSPLMASNDHNAMVRAAAQASLGPLGLSQKGRSRLWVDDHGWWLIAVEFQPSGSSKGTYCNIGYSHLWLERDHLAFEDFERISIDGGELLRFDPATPEAFSTQVQALANAAAGAVDARREAHGDGPVALQRLAQRRGDIYDDYHAAAAAGLVGNRALADQAFDRVASAEDPRQWVAEVKQTTARLAALLDAPSEFAEELAHRVKRTRDALGLRHVQVMWDTTDHHRPPESA